MANTAIPSTNTHADCEAASSTKPSPPMAIPVIIVGSAPRFFTIRLTTTWSRMIIPASITVTCSASNTKSHGRPTPRSRLVTPWLTGARSTKSRR